VSLLPILDQPVHVKGPVETALDALWLARSPHFYSLRNVRTVLRLRRRFSLRMLRLDDLQVKIPGHELPDCDSCVDLCCTGKDAVVSLRLRDIAVLLDQGRDDVIAWDRPPSPPRARWARREADASVFHRAFPILQRDATGTCALLTEERLCGLFPSWPLSCARYPYALDLQRKVIFYARSCPTRRAAVDVKDAPVHVRRLALAVVEAYNARVRDVVLLAMAKPELAALGLLQHVRLDELGL
jgi:hypothetical protein